MDLVGLTIQAPPKVLQPPILEPQGGAGGSGSDESDEEEPVADFDGRWREGHGCRCVLRDELLEHCRLPQGHCCPR